jgi:hypothetical protein
MPIVHRVFRADLRRPSDAQGEARKQLLSDLRRTASLCAEFGNRCLTSNYLIFRHRNDKELGPVLEALREEQVEARRRYREWGEKLSSYARDAIVSSVTGLIKARGREVLRGECSLPTYRRTGAIRVRERGVRLERRDGRLFCSFCAEPGKWVELELWVRNLHKSPRYAAVLEGLLSGKYKIGQAQILIEPHNKVSVRMLYQAEVQEAPGEGMAEIVASAESGIGLKIGERVEPFEFDAQEASRHKQAIEARRVRAWRLLRGRRLRRRWPKIYRSGTLSRLSTAWVNYQRTWSQQLAAAVVHKAEDARVRKISVPTAEKFSEALGKLIDFSQLSQAIVNAAEARGMTVTQVSTEREQRRELRKEEVQARRKAKETAAAAEGLQPLLQV